MVLETDRLQLRRLDAGDAEFIVRLLNEPSFLRFIGDRGVRTPADARRFLREGPLASYDRHGFGLWAVIRKRDGARLGICGLLRREGLDDPDLGFALLPDHWRRGYALESASAVLDHARSSLGLARVVAITSPGNNRSERLLARLGLRFERSLRLPSGSEVRLFATRPAARSVAESPTDG